MSALCPMAKRVCRTSRALQSVFKLLAPFCMPTRRSADWLLSSLILHAAQQQPGGHITGSTLLDDIKMFRGDQSLRMSVDVEDALHRLYDGQWKPGTTPDTTIREDGHPLTTAELSRPNTELGGCMKWVGRGEAQQSVNFALKNMAEDWSKAQRGQLTGDMLRRADKRAVLVGQPGSGKTSMAQRMVLDAIDNVDPELQGMLQQLKTNNLQYRMDFAEHPRLLHERDGTIRPAQSLALRLLYLFCAQPVDRSDQQFETYAMFINSLMQTTAQKEAALLLARLDVRHVMKAAREHLLGQGCSPAAFHLILDEFQHGLEVEEERQKKADSDFLWKQEMLEAQAFSWHMTKDLLLVTICMGLVPMRVLAGSGSAQSHVIPLRLLTNEETEEIYVNLQSRLLEAEYNLQEGLKNLSQWAYGNPRYLACILTVAAHHVQGSSLRRDRTDYDVLLQGLAKLLGKDEIGLDLTRVLPMALDAVQTGKTGISVDRWLDFENGHLIKVLLAHSILQRRVVRGRAVHVYKYSNDEPSMTGSTALTFEMLEGFSVLALEPTDFQDKYTVVLSPFVFKLFYDKAGANNWLPSSENFLLDTLGTYLTPELKERADLSTMLLKLWAVRLLDGPTCKLGTFLQEALPRPDMSLDKALAELEIKLPEELFAQKFTECRGWHTNTTFKDHIKAAREGKRFAYVGCGNERKADWWLLLPTAKGEPNLVLLEGQSKCHQYLDTPESLQTLRDEHRKRFPTDKKMVSCFIFCTDGTQQGCLRAKDVVVFDATCGLWLCGPYGKLRRADCYFQAAKRVKVSERWQRL